MASKNASVVFPRVWHNEYKVTLLLSLIYAVYMECNKMFTCLCDVYENASNLLALIHTVFIKMHEHCFSNRGRVLLCNCWPVGWYVGRSSLHFVTISIVRILTLFETLVTTRPIPYLHQTLSVLRMSDAFSSTSYCRGI